VLNAPNALYALYANAPDEPVPAHGRRALRCPRTTSGRSNEPGHPSGVCRLGPLTRVGNRESVNPNVLWALSED
jgi:hypothetical protein